jgi:coenzyme F420-0:L-glutamate ligase/coenzyme F420-1:gamma-L-glutamate ligase
MNAAPQLHLIAVPGCPMIGPGDDLVEVLLTALASSGLALESGDIVVVAQKIVSKSEGRQIDLTTVTPSVQALKLARHVAKDPRLVELVLGESKRIVRAAKDVLIVEHRLGFVLANAGIDQSNVACPEAGEYALLLPADPDGSARRLRDQLRNRTQTQLAVIISDSFGRPWRIGTVGVAIGAAGLPSLLDLRGQPDLFGRTLRVTLVGHADELASAASLLMGQSTEAKPFVIVRGLPHTGIDLPAAQLLRPEREDLFR